MSQEEQQQENRSNCRITITISPVLPFLLFLLSHYRSHTFVASILSDECRFNLIQSVYLVVTLSKHTKGFTHSRVVVEVVVVVALYIAHHPTNSLALSLSLFLAGCQRLSGSSSLLSTIVLLDGAVSSLRSSSVWFSSCFFRALTRALVSKKVNSIKMLHFWRCLLSLVARQQHWRQLWQNLAS